LTDDNRVDGQVAVVTGGSRGIGRAVALALAERGADVAVLSRTVEASEVVAEQVRGRGRRAFAGGGDVADWAAVERLVRAASERLGPIDILINNAGSGGSHGYVWQLDSDVFRDTLMVNVLGPFHFMKALLPLMTERKHGVVVNVSSGNARSPGPARSMYGTTKSGLDYLSKSASTEVAEAGVRVYSFYPGPTDTDMQTHLRTDPHLPSDIRQQMEARLTEGRLFRPEQPAAGIAWLVSPAGAAWTEPICAWSTPEIRTQIEKLPGYVAG
jgi:NAD(P)-dependent dehydrogenase (short-subunit alcohol dehydrogenase family)